MKLDETEEKKYPHLNVTVMTKDVQQPYIQFTFGQN